jgi:L-cysteine desulfidase
MIRGDALYNQFIAILKEELRPAMGCTEPIALAYAGAKAREVLGTLPTRIDVFVSGNIIKNVKSVVVPNTGGLRGIAAAVCAGVVAGDASKVLEVISSVSKEKQAELKQYMQQVEINIEPSSAELVFDIDLTLYAGEDKARVRIVNHHTNIVHISRNGDVMVDLPTEESSEDNLTDKTCLSIERIVEFADVLDPEDVRDSIGRQIQYNMAIAREGLENNWGANIGSVILNQQGTANNRKAAAWAAAGSDARMSGCEMPVIILSGSGNQGITASVPVAVYAEAFGASEAELFRAVAVSDLVTVHQKTGIGRLSAYCGAISAGCGAGAGIAYLHGGNHEAVAHTVVNAIAILSGTICDGAKPSCAAKIAAAVDAGILGYNMYLENQQFFGGDGIVTKGADKTVSNVGILAREGMRETDRTILKIMLSDGC